MCSFLPACQDNKNANFVKLQQYIKSLARMCGLKKFYVPHTCFQIPHHPRYSFYNFCFCICVGHLQKWSKIAPLCYQTPKKQLKAFENTHKLQLWRVFLDIFRKDICLSLSSSAKTVGTIQTYAGKYFVGPHR